MANKNKKREDLFRIIVETIRSSLDIKTVKQRIVEVIGEALKADRCFILEYDKAKDKFLKVSEEYLSSNEMLAYTGTDLNENIPKLASEFKKGKSLLLNKSKALLNGQEFDLNDGSFEAEKNAIQYYKVYSVLVFPIYYLNDFLGDLVLHYVDSTHEAGGDEINLLKDIAGQIAIALHQANLYKLVKKNAEKENILRKLIETIRTTINLDETKQTIVKIIGETLNAARCFITDYDQNENRFLPIKYEYLSSKEITSVIGLDVHEIVPGFIEALKSGKYLLVKNKEIFLDIKKQDFTIEQENLKKYGINSVFAVPLFYKNNFLGVLSIHYIDEASNIEEFEINLMKDIANQVAMAIYQANLYKSLQKYAEREKLLREITESIRSSIDIEITKQSIVDTIGKALNADRCFIIEYDKTGDVFINIEYEYLSSNDIIGFTGANPQVEFPVFANAIKMGKTLLIQNGNIILDFENQDFSVEKQSLQKYGLNSGYALPIYYKDEPLGLIAVHYVKEERLIADDEISLLQTISNQIAIALHQSKLYNDTLVYAERERISKNIIEILRSSIDKAIIKKLFVKNIGKFLNADRVFLAEYDYNEKKFMPVDKDSEYLSSPNEKSVIGIDWSQNFIRDYYQAVQEEREVKIFSMNEYIKDKELEGDIKIFLEEANIKSSYSFPVLYQYKVLASFGIDFTQQNTSLSDEDIGRIRNMCTQAGIALYHAALYEEAQKCFQARKSFISEYSETIKNPVDEILDTSKLLSQNEFERTVQIEYLNKIINACNTLLELTKGISGD